MEDVLDMHSFKSFKDTDTMMAALSKVLYVSKEAKQLLEYGQHCTYIDNKINVYLTSDDYYRAILNPGLAFFIDPLPFWCIGKDGVNIKSLFYAIE